MPLSRTTVFLLTLGKKSHDSAVGLMRKLSSSQRRKVARMLIKNDFAWVVAHTLELYDVLDEDIGMRLISVRKDLAGIVARNLGKFGDEASQQRLISAFRTHGQAWAKAHIPEKKAP